MGVSANSVRATAAQVVVASTAWQPSANDAGFLTDPRLLDQLAPAADAGNGHPLRNAEHPAGLPPGAVPDLPLLNEFPAEREVVAESSAINRLQSLMHQTAGDAAFRSQDYAASIASYERALRLAPERRSPRMRLALAAVAVGDYPQAAARLKSCLLLPPDPTSAWIPAEQLYGPDSAIRTLAHVRSLREWLSERPLSADRLLLTGTFQLVRGQTDTGLELLELARHPGQESGLVDELIRLSSSGDPGARPPEPGVPGPGEVRPPAPPAAAAFGEPVVVAETVGGQTRGGTRTNVSRPPEDGGIVLRGRHRQASR